MNEGEHRNHKSRKRTSILVLMAWRRMMVNRHAAQHKSLSEDLEVYRHWSPESETYAPAYVLLQFIRQAWQLDEMVVVELFPCARSYQHVQVYYFTLRRDDEQIWMPVLANPVVLQLIKSYGLTVRRPESYCSTTHHEIACESCSDSCDRDHCTREGSSAWVCCCPGPIAKH